MITKSPQMTEELGSKLAKHLLPGSFIALAGELGSGKTVFTKGIARGLDVKEYRYVNSPSFVIIKEYAGRIPLYHFDIYRLDSSQALDSVGYEDYFYGKGVTVVEWADKIKDILPRDRIDVRFLHISEKERSVNIDIKDKRYEDIGI